MHHLKHVFVAAALSASMTPALADVITLDVEGIDYLASEPLSHIAVFFLDDEQVILHSTGGIKAGAYRNCTMVSASGADAAHSISLVATDVDHDMGIEAVVPPPEPSAMPMLLSGLFAIGFAARQRRSGWHG